MTHDREWSEALDGPRFRAGFSTLCRTVTQWPQPQHLINALPPREQKALAHSILLTDAERQASAEALRKVAEDLAKELRVPPPVSRETEREKIDTVAAEQELRTHYADAKTRAAGGDA